MIFQVVTLFPELVEAGLTAGQVDLVVPHQANLRIIEAVAKYAGIAMDKVVVTVHKYGNMSSATVPVALVEALDAGRVAPGSHILIPAFGGGLTYCALLVRWGERITPLGHSDADIAPCHHTALELVNQVRAKQDARGRSHAGLMTPLFAELRMPGASSSVPQRPDGRGGAASG